MSGGPLLPSSVYLGGASGNLYPNFYVPNTNTNSAGAFEGIGVVASLGSDAAAVLQFNLPPTIPTGVVKLRCLATANATSGVAKVTVKDGQASAGSNIGASSLSTETQLSQSWSVADVLVENKIVLTTAPVSGDIFTVLVTFNSTGWTLGSASTWQFSLVWE